VKDKGNILRLEKCYYDGETAVYQCMICGKPVCLNHVRTVPACYSCLPRTDREFSITEKKEENSSEIEELSRVFWGEAEQLTFDMRLNIHELSGYIAESEEELMGFIAYQPLEEDMLIAALAVLPGFQGTGIGKALVQKVGERAQELSKRRLLVSTSNDDLPALAFYQKLGFQIFAVETDIIKEKHRKSVTGFGRIPVRDEIKLRKPLNCM
jgi:ribosomal protein S18 acetylase RimI-like enzyme